MDDIERLRRMELESSLNELRRIGKGPLGNMNFQDMLYLDIIHYNDGCTASYIADSLGIARSAVTVRLNRLERNGWVSRTRSEADGRQYVLSLTGDALEVYDSMVTEMEKAMRALRERYPKGDVDRFMEMLEFLTDRFGSRRPSSFYRLSCHHVGVV